MWITNSPIADVFVVWAKSEATGKIRGFVLERGTEGPSPRRRSRARSRCAPRSPARSCWITSRCRRRTCCRTPQASPARSAASTAPATASPGARWALPGFCWHRARGYTLDRKQFGRPLAANQLIQKKLADMQTEIALGLHGALRVGRLIDAGRVAPPR
jgi:glutaryl-CoA dehydrogenase